MTQEEFERYTHSSYIIIVGDSVADLEEKVNEVLNLKHCGKWETVGGVAVTNDNVTMRFYQAMRKVK